MTRVPDEDLAKHLAFIDTHGERSWSAMNSVTVEQTNAIVRELVERRAAETRLSDATLKAGLHLFKENQDGPTTGDWTCGTGRCDDCAWCFWQAWYREHGASLFAEATDLRVAANRLVNLTSPFVVVKPDLLHAARAAVAAIVDKR